MKSLIIFLPFYLLFSCKTAEKTAAVPPPPPLPPAKVELLCLIDGCPLDDPLSLYEFNGIGFEKIQEARMIGKDSFLFNLPIDQSRFYYLGTQKLNKRPILLGEEPTIRLKGNCKQLRAASIEGSSLNVNYNKMMNEVRGIQRKMSSLANALRQAQNDLVKFERIKKEMAAVDTKQQKYRDSLMGVHPFLAKVATLSFYQSFPNNQGRYANEIEYYANEFFHYTDLTDADYNRIPPIFESFKSFAQTLASVGIRKEGMQTYVNNHLQKIALGSSAKRYALGGVVVGLQAKNHPAFADFAEKFIEEFGGDTDSDQIALLQKQIKQAASFTDGAQAPDFTQTTPEGKPLSLSDLRGKVVLIDFWASWCGPCRRENPNVVRLYNKYKDQGFEVLGVSLDRTKDRWVNAIEKDGLTWKHVSDLKGWKNEVAKTYSVRSIPHTVLVDKEGNIIARNLRGAGLENQLARIFGK